MMGILCGCLLDKILKFLDKCLDNPYVVALVLVVLAVLPSSFILYAVRQETQAQMKQCNDSGGQWLPHTETSCRPGVHGIGFYDVSVYSCEYNRP